MQIAGVAGCGKSNVDTGNTREVTATKRDNRKKFSRARDGVESKKWC